MLKTIPPAVWASALAVTIIGAQAANSPANTTSASTSQSIELFPDKIVAKAKDFQIKRSEIDKAFTAYKTTAASQGQAIPESRRAEIEASILDRLINVRLLSGMATSEDTAPAKAEAEKLYLEYKGRYPSEEAFNRQVVSMGMTLEQFRDRLLEESTVRRIIEREVKSKVKITNEQAKRFYDENPERFDLPARVRASHILFLKQDQLTRQELPEAQKQEIQKLAEQVLARAKAGEDFAKLAKEYSQDPGSKSQGGELPVFSHGRMVPEFETEAFKLKPDEIGGLVKTQFGYHIIKAHENIPARKVPYAEAQENIREFLAIQETQEKLPDFLKKIRAEAGVEILESPRKTE